MCSQYLNIVKNKMKASNEHLYLSGGNEARLKKAWENRDPRLNYNVIMPYGEDFWAEMAICTRREIRRRFLMYIVGR